MVKLNTSSLNSLNLNSAVISGTGEVQRGTASGGGGIVPLPPSVPEEPEPNPTYTLSASVANGAISATLNGSAISLPYEANEGDVIVVSVEANDGFTFEGWADGVTDNPRTITMASDVVLSAECVAIPSESKYIQFADAEVERVLMSKGVSSDGVGITIEDAERVTSISTWFKGNTAITSFEEFAYFKNVTSLVANAFDGCTSLAKMSLPTSLTTIGAYALRNVPAPMVLNAPNLATIGTASFNGSGLVEIKDLGKVSIIGSTSAVVQATSGVFANCKNLTKANISASVTHIGGMAFVGCTALTSVTGCEGVTNIVKQQAFDGCSALVGRMILPSIKVVDQYSFRNCKLEYIELGTDCTTIAAYAFQNNSTLTAFVCRATTPPSLGNTNAFSDTNSCPIYVPDASVEAYKTATNWNTYADRIKPLSEIEGIKRVRFNYTGVSLEYFPTENDALEMDFEDIEYINDMHYFGKPQSDGRGYTMTAYNSAYYFGADGGEGNGGVWVVGRKLIQYNVGQGNNVFINGQQIGAYSSVGEHYSYQHLYVGLRSNNANLNGYLYSFRVYDKTTGEDKVRLKPVIHNGIVQFYDEVRDLYLSYIVGNPLTIE